ncbi:dinuclear metal center protein, YbgI/SA1388 family [Paucidesulfovibrio gracilis DSM 16080]|uniref:GTP cyclohydrolase 1 type 2 homolog n=1 Tax=Paucidesulfovibrio gracilis DSM 16080 TaxID=1121449 RepID=A0A1T4XU96_9BACT|nr:Nif3-like dinuclear metal center hexameric protein [Paucidesulfovibrio gracilis]SKA93126.1 dinuclear metal center protein, YbgI/SA1388 family [Paucidesulfovibrio gracilis DSM 16080]
MKIKEIIATLQALAPERYAAPWDNSGIQLAGTRHQARRLAVCLDPLPEQLALAVEWDADFVLSHHPLYMKPTAPVTDGPYLRALRTLLPSGAWLYAAHTSLDSSPRGTACWLGDELGLEDRQVLEPGNQFDSVSVSFFLQEDLDGDLADELADLDGVFGVAQEGTGEVRILCHGAAWENVRARLDRALDQGGMERTAYFRTRLAAPCETVGFGESGRLPGKLPYEQFTALLGGLVGRDQWNEIGPRPENVRRVAYLPGSGASALDAALRSGADVFITGDVKYHAALDAVQAGLHVLDVGHFCLEEEMMRRFAGRLEQELEGVEIRFLPGVDPLQSRVAR